ncbi:toll/interleukin-1 receptor domain-containing protein [Rothia terrae]|uniref:Toll/interleukin-1 receptor domain-containing protein n=1 Tax=Rothia terrae TaxID=396015 RepID=A0A7S6WWH1_9MICC|nr:toll/interleukin-1 receptor domain-containing protein [Rothia terrae]QOW64793.1 toll/interleukin-1 receptor domain-containing protein [Rothia terrae]
MAQCTAPTQGHRTASGRANCPACSNRGYSSYSNPSYYYPGYSSTTTSNRVSSSTSSKKSFRKGSTVSLSATEYTALKPVHEQSVKQAEKYPDKRDLFLCHAWDDRAGAAKELHDALENLGVSVWFSEKDIELGTSLTRSIDKGLKNSRIGIILVTPSFYKRVDAAGIAEQELSALLRSDRVIPIVHETTYEELAEMSPLLAARSGLNTEGSSFEDVAEKLAEAVLVD